MWETIKKYKIQLIFVIIVLLEFALFRTYVLREIEGSCPRNIDQAVFMRITYSLYDNIINGNYGTAFKEVYNSLGQGAFPVFGLIALFLFGKSRLSLLLVNFILFILAQLIGFCCVKLISNSNKIGFLFWGLFMMIQSPFFGGGGDLVDYRMDFAGFCLYSCWVSTLMLAYHKQKKQYYYLSAVFVGLLFLFRSNTIAYVSIALLLFECLNIFVYKQKIFEELCNLLKYGCIVLASGGWYILFQIKNLYHYYITAHVTSAEPEIRMVEQGIGSWISYILFYPYKLVKDHLGYILSFVLVFIVLVSVILYMVNRNKKKLKLQKNEVIAFCAGFCSFCAPFIVLTLDVSKSAVVICTVAGAAVFISSYIFALICNRKLIIDKVLLILMFVIAGAGIVSYVGNTTKGHVGYDVQSQSQMLAINNRMKEYLIDNDLKEARLLVDRICDAITTDVLTVLTYESESQYIDVGYAWNGLNTYANYSYEEVETALEEADIMVLSRDGYTTQSYYPTDSNFDQYRDIMWQYASDNLINLGEFELGNDKVVIFGKGQVKVQPMWDDWMSNTGNYILFEKELDQQQSIYIEGYAGGIFKNGDLKVDAVYGENSVLSNIEIIDDRYYIEVDISKFDLGSYELEMIFDKYFIPKELGTNEDTRRLVIMRPDTVSIK